MGVAWLERLEGIALWEGTHLRVLALFCVAIIVVNFSIGMFAAILTALELSLKFTTKEVGGLISINLAAGAVISPLISWSGLRPVRLKLMGLGLLFSAASSVLGALAKDYTALAIAQLGIGAGTTFVNVYGPPMLTVVAPAGSVSKYMGAFYLAAPIGNAAGLLLGGYLADMNPGLETWRYNFWVYAGMAAACGLAALPFGHVKPSPEADVKASPPERLPFFTQMRICFSHPLFVLLIIAFGLAGFIIAAYGSFLPQYVQVVYKQNVHWASTLIGIVIAPSVVIGIVASSLFADWIVKGHPGSRKRFQLRVGSLAIVVAAGLPIVGIVFFMPKLWAFLVVLVIGLILVFCIPSPATVSVLEILEPSLRTHAMGWVNFFYNSIGAIPGPLVLGTLLDVYWDRYRIAFVICAIAILIIWLLIGLSYWLSDSWFATDLHTDEETEAKEIAEVVRDAETLREAEAAAA